MGIGQTKPGGNQSSFLNPQENGKTTGAEESPVSKTDLQQQALEKITGLLANPEALDALCRDLFESMSVDEGSRCISRSRLSMLTRLVINCCQVSDPSSLQELLDVLVPLHSQLLEDGEEPPQMEYEGFLPHARCVLRVVDAVLRVELKGQGVGEFHKTIQDLVVLEENGNDSHGNDSHGEELEDLSATLRKRSTRDHRAVIITTEDLRDARGSISVAAAVAEAAMPESVVPESQCEPISPEVATRNPTKSPRIAATSPAPVVRSPIFGDPRLPWPLPTATPPFSMRAPVVTSISGNMATSSSRASLGSSSSISRRPLQQSVSCSSLLLDSSNISSMSEVTGKPTRVRASTPRAPLRNSTPTASLPSSRSTMPAPVVRRPVIGTPRQCSPQCRQERISVAVPTATSVMPSLPDLLTINGTARSQSPTRPGTGCIRTPVGPLCVAPIPTQVPQLDPTQYLVVAPPADCLSAPVGRSASPRRPGSHPWATTLPHPSRSCM